MTTFQNRKSLYPIEEQFLSRVSYRAFSDRRLTEDELLSLFEAARWAPSSYNNQPWRFVYARQGEKGWDTLFNVLVDFNKSWCQHADTLVAVISRQNFERNDKPSPTASFDTGSAWMSLALEAHAKGFFAHGMSGFDYEALKKALQIPDGFKVEAMIAIGHPGSKESLPKELQEQEVPSTRRPLSEIVANGHFPFK